MAFTSSLTLISSALSLFPHFILYSSLFTQMSVLGIDSLFFHRGDLLFLRSNVGFPRVVWSFGTDNGDEKDSPVTAFILLCDYLHAENRRY